MPNNCDKSSFLPLILPNYKHFYILAKCELILIVPLGKWNVDAEQWLTEKKKKCFIFI